MENATPFLWVALGGAIGASTRFAAVQWAVADWGSSFPWGTLVVNVTGSLVIGILGALLAGRDVDPAWRLFLITGVLGGYTTFSAFSFETLALLLEQRWIAAASYVVGSVFLGLIATGLGYGLVMQLRR